MKKAGESLSGFIQFPQDHFRRCEVFFFLIAAPAADHHISFGTAASPGKRDDMVERQLTCRKFFMAVIADALSEKFLKMGGFPQFPCLFPFPFYMSIIFVYFDPVIH